MASRGSITWQMEDQGRPKNIIARSLSWNGIFMMITPKKRRHVGRRYHSRGLRILQCNRWVSLTLIVVVKKLFTQVVKKIVVDYKTKIDLDVFGQLEEQNVMLKKFLLYAIVERKNMRTCTLFAMTKARQFEVKFESIQKEWNRN